MKKIIAVVGARPQFIKHFAFENEAKLVFDLKTIHTGQHYDANMSQVFFDTLGMEKPDYQLQLGGGHHGKQTGSMMVEIEDIFIKEKPDTVVVYGDTNSTLAASLVASKLHIPVAHIEAGLRSFNKEMPEEINRVLTDHISDWLFVPSEVALQNLSKEGIKNNVFNVGDIMKDLVLQSIKENWMIEPKQSHKEFVYVTLHRPYNTDEKSRLEYVLSVLNNLSYPAIFSIHPRTSHAMTAFGMEKDQYQNIEFIEPQNYFENLGYIYYSQALITDSGGMQKEAYWLSKKCVTVRKETEWIETLEDGANTLIFNDLENISNILKGMSNFAADLYGTGNTARQIIKILS